MHKISYAFFLNLLIVLVLTSCFNGGTGTNLSTPTNQNFGTTTNVPNNTPSPTAYQSTPEPTLLPSIIMKCASNSIGDMLDLDGTVAMSKPGRQLDFEPGFLLLNLNTSKSIPVNAESLSAQISPDRQHLAYTYILQSSGKLQIRVLDVSGKTIIDLPLTIDGKRHKYFDWQNSEQLRLIHTNLNEVSSGLFNPFTETYSSLKLDWPGAYRPSNPYEDKVADWKFDRQATDRFYVYGANILYDPTITRVIYAKANGVVSLVNVETQTEISNARFKDWGRLPKWSPNGDYFAILNHEANVDEFYIISRDDNAFQRITAFSEDFDFVFISEYAWSPDSKKIAFWLKVQDDEQNDGVQSELAILDISSMQVTRLCLEGISTNAYEPWSMNHPEPIWSPDGKYIMITQWDDPTSPRKYYVLVIDPVTGAVERISENTAPIGWMVSEP